MARIAIVQESVARGDVADAYREMRELFGLVPDVMKLLSLRPDLLKLMFGQYKAMFGRGVLPRAVKEMIATVVSKTNSCHY